jgi:hypothetical protein
MIRSLSLPYTNLDQAQMNTTHVLAQELKRFLPWHQTRLDCLSRLIVALIQVRTVNLTQLALTFTVRLN